MIRNNQILFLLTFGILLLGCNQNKIYEEHYSDFPNNRWEESDKIDFMPNITDKEQNYKLIIAFRHVYGFQFKAVNIEVDITNPSGKTIYKNLKLEIYDKNNKCMSDCIGDFCDLETVIDDDYKFKEIGTYKISILNKSGIEILPNVIDIGLIIEKIKI